MPVSCFLTSPRSLVCLIGDLKAKEKLKDGKKTPTHQTLCSSGRLVCQENSAWKAVGSSCCAGRVMRACGSQMGDPHPRINDCRFPALLRPAQRGSNRHIGGEGKPFICTKHAVAAPPPPAPTVLCIGCKASWETERTASACECLPNCLGGPSLYYIDPITCKYSSL